MGSDIRLALNNTVLLFYNLVDFRNSSHNVHSSAFWNLILNFISRFVFCALRGFLVDVRVYLK